MSSPSHVRFLFLVLVPVSIALTVYLYAYPIFHGCAFVSPGASNWHSFLQTVNRHVYGLPDATSVEAPFRLLVFGDPQLEGDSSLGEPRLSLLGWPSTYLPYLRKRLDLIGNDYYLAHIYRSMHWWTDPTHVAVLGDLLGSQWLTDVEFERRASRFWKRVFRGAHRVEDERMEEEQTENLGHDRDWNRRVINIAGNHDVGYAGDMIRPRIERFEKAFGKANWAVTFQLAEDGSANSDADTEKPRPQLRVVVLNSLNLDGPEVDEDLRRQTYDFLNHVILTSRAVEEQEAATLLLTHIPLPKRDGVCVDGPYIAYNEQGYGGGIKEQNHLTEDSGKAILESIFGMSGSIEAPNKGLGRPGIILTGHDHEGCDVYHHLSYVPTGEPSSEPGWNATRWENAANIARNGSIPGIREVTVRSMMGEFGGTAGLLSAWYDPAMGRWRFEYSSCSLGVQHVWWTIHVLDLITLLGIFIVISSSLNRLYSNSASQGRPRRDLPELAVDERRKRERRSATTALEEDGHAPPERRRTGSRRRPR